MVRLVDSDRLDRAALLAAAGGGACMAAGALLKHSGPAPWIVVAGPLCVLAAAAAGGWRERLRGALLGAAALALAVAWWRYGLFAQMATGALAGFGLAHNADRMRRREGREGAPRALLACAAGAAALAWPVAVRAVLAVEHSALARGAVPPLLLETAAGALAGLVLGLSAFPVHLERAGDRVLEALQKARPVLDGELRELVHKVVDARARALKLLERSRADEGARADTRRGLDQIALTAIELADRFAAVDRVLARTPASGVEERSAALRAQLAGEEDPGVRRDLERAVAALDEQRAQIERLQRGRARLVARLHSELAGLEKTEMSLALLATGDAAMSGLRLETLGASLEGRARELEAEGQALQETLTVAPAQALRKVAETRDR